VELALPARKISSRYEFILVLVTAGGILGANTLVGFLLGLGAALLIRIASRH
jgi:hypothetical protein